MYNISPIVRGLAISLSARVCIRIGQILAEIKQEQLNDGCRASGGKSALTA